MFKKIIISEQEYNLKIPKQLQGKPIEIYIFPVEEKSKRKVTKKIDFGYE
jgi:hypothetical protein